MEAFYLHCLSETSDSIDGLHEHDISQFWILHDSCMIWSLRFHYYFTTISLLFHDFDDWVHDYFLCPWIRSHFDGIRISLFVMIVWYFVIISWLFYYYAKLDPKPPQTEIQKLPYLKSSFAIVLLFPVLPNIYIYTYIQIYTYIHTRASAAAPPTFPHVLFLSHSVSEGRQCLRVPSLAMQVFKT